ncbi:MAG: hypothetical protein CM15mP80_03360 [Alphaproteobacteria bacterium]|nr:MAG: hypothetical protein CM15mP80_03360 [Alphaproteobacteria bacterium]
MMPGQMIGVFCTLSAVAFGLVAGLIIKVLSMILFADNTILPLSILSPSYIGRGLVGERW